MLSTPPLKIIRRRGRRTRFLLPSDTWSSFLEKIEGRRQEALSELNVYYCSLYQGRLPTEAEAIAYYETHSKTGGVF